MLDTASFVDELFVTFTPKDQPAAGAQQQQEQQPQDTSAAMSASQQPFPFNSPSGPSRTPYGSSMGGGYPQGPGLQDGANFNRKRSYNDSEQDHEDQQSYNRAFKTPRRGRGGGRGDWMGREGRPAPGAASGFPQPPASGFPSMPSAFPGFDQNDPMAAMMALQGMGFPQMPGMPPMPMPPGVSGQQPQPDQMGKSSELCPFYVKQGICYLGATCPYQHEAIPTKEDEYDPKSSNIMMDFQHHGPEAPVRGSDRGRGRGRGDRGGFGGRGRRSEFSSAGPNEDTSITTIVVEQIPGDKLNEESVREFFSQYGEIVDLSLQPHKKLALITYDSHASAKQAWSSPKVIFDNRFVKVYWHKPKTDQRGTGEGAPEAPAFNQEEFERQQEEAQKAYEEKMQRRRETDNAKQALEQQRDGLLRKQQEEKERLLQRLQEKGVSANGNTNSENGTPAVDDEDVSDQTKQLRAQLASLESEAQSMGLDLNKSETGSPAFGARGRGRGFPGSRGRGYFAPRGRGYDPSYRGRGRGSFRGGRGGVLRLDNRPKRVAVSGIDNPEKDEGLRQYLIVRSQLFHGMFIHALNSFIIVFILTKSGPGRIRIRRTNSRSSRHPNRRLQRTVPSREIHVRILEYPLRR